MKSCVYSCTCPTWNRHSMDDNWRENYSRVVYQQHLHWMTVPRPLIQSDLSLSPAHNVTCTMHPVILFSFIWLIWLQNLQLQSVLPILLSSRCVLPNCNCLESNSSLEMLLSHKLLQCSTGIYITDVSCVRRNIDRLTWDEIRKYATATCQSLNTFYLLWSLDCNATNPHVIKHIQ